MYQVYRDVNRCWKKIAVRKEKQSERNGDWKGIVVRKELLTPHSFSG